jgi:hypothetical protein
LFDRIKSSFTVKSSKESETGELAEKVTALQAQQEALQQGLTELRQQLDGREGAISGRLMELAQEIREMKRAGGSE